MENATKALLIAASILLLILMLSLMNYVFRNIGEDTSDIYSMLEESDIEEYNQIFLNYEGQTSLTIQDVASIINLAQENKEINGTTIKITITIDWVSNNPFNNGSGETKIQISNVDNYDTEEMLKAKLEETTEYTYECSINYGTSTKLVETITITEKTT